MVKKKSKGNRAISLSIVMSPWMEKWTQKDSVKWVCRGKIEGLHKSCRFQFGWFPSLKQSAAIKQNIDFGMEKVQQQVEWTVKDTALRVTERDGPLRKKMRGRTFFSQTKKRNTSSLSVIGQSSWLQSPHNVSTQFHKVQFRMCHSDVWAEFTTVYQETLYKQN